MLLIWENKHHKSWKSIKTIVWVNNAIKWKVDQVNKFGILFYTKNKPLLILYKYRD
jgi:hypothetical protein